MGKIYRALDEAFDNCPNCMAVAQMDWNIGDDTVVRPDVMALCAQNNDIALNPPTVALS